MNTPTCAHFIPGNKTPSPVCGPHNHSCGRDGKPLAFIHIPKTGGTTIEDVGRDHGARWGRFYRTKRSGVICAETRAWKEGSDYVLVHPRVDGFLAIWASFMFGIMRVGNVAHHPAWMLPDWDNPYLGGRNFCVFRNPYTRMISQYKFLIAGKWDPEQVNMTGHPMGQFPACTPVDMNHVLQVSIKRYKYGNGLWKYLQDFHIFPMYDYAFGPDGRQWCHHILKMETLASDFNALMEKEGLPMRLPEEKVSNPAAACSGRRLTFDDLTDETKALIEDVYRKDFEIGGYAIGEAG